MAVIVDDRRALYGVDPDVVASEWPKPDPNRLDGVQPRIFQPREEFDASVIHPADRLVIGQIDILAPF
jgi:hypothetical protein